MESSRRRENTPVSWITGIAKAQLLFLAAGTVLLLLFTWIAFCLEDPDSVLIPLALSALCLSSLAGGIGAVRFTGDGILSGCISGVISMTLVHALSLLPLPAASAEMGQTLLFTCLIPVLSVCGAVLGKKRKKQGKHRRR